MRTTSRSSVLKGLTVLVAALPLLAGCGAGGGGAETVSDRGDELNPVYGVDYAWARPSLGHLKSEGYGFVARYLSYDTTGKSLSAGEARAIEAAGMDVVVVWEESGTDALSGYAAGASDARAADAQARADGMPGGRPIYFACDFDAQPSQFGAIDAYFDGVASVIGRGRTGVYGGFGLVEHLFNASKVAWAWQTYAWSGGNWDSRAQLRQIQNGVEGGSCDKDEAVAADFGQWGPSAPEAPPPAPKPPTATPAKPTGCGDIPEGHGLTNGDSFSSCDGRFSLAMQTDGNLVLYQNGVKPLWSTGTDGKGGFAAIMQTDGNFVLYGKQSDAMWNSATEGHAGAHLAVQDDGNMVVYASDGHALWASNTVVAAPAPPPPPPPPPAACTLMSPGHELTAGQQLSSCDGHHTLAMQTDGNLVLYHNGVGALWATGTNGKGGQRAIMQGDGNFVVYDAANKPLWNSVTEGHAGAYLDVQDDGNLVVYAPGGAPLWDTRTNGR
jgi:hypothetical protein